MLQLLSTKAHSHLIDILNLNNHATDSAIRWLVSRFVSLIDRQLVSHLVYSCISLLVCLSVSQSIIQSVSQLVSQSVRQSDRQSDSQSVRQSVSQPASQTVSQTDRQLVSQFRIIRTPIYNLTLPGIILFLIRHHMVLSEVRK